MKSKLVRFFSVLMLSSLTFFSGLLNTQAQEQKILVYLDGQSLNLDQEPIILDGTTYVPMRDVFEAFGFEIDWNQEKKRIKAKSIENNYIMVLQVESKKINICGNDDNLEKAPLMVNNRVLIPVRALSEKLNAEVVWDSQNRSIIIESSSEPIITSTSRDFNYQNSENNSFWSDKTWEDNNISPDNKTNNLYDLYGLYDLYDLDDSDNYNHFRKEHNHHRFDNRYKDFYYYDGKDNSDENLNNSLGDGLSDIDKNKYEKEVLDLVNAERAKENLNPLKWNDKLADIARNHSKDMIERNFFDHTNPDGKSPFDRYSDNEIEYSFAAENIAAGNKTPKDVVNSWMNSQGHRENILKPDLKELGVGLALGGQYGYYWTQCFIG